MCENPIPIHTVDVPWLHGRDVQVAVLRCDLVHPLWSGNKFFKLKYNLEAARAQQSGCVLSFGGAWSNHLHALAAAGQALGLRTIGVIRGEEPQQLNACLQDARAMGMHLHFVSRAAYAHKTTPEFSAALEREFGAFYLIPEGGANLAGIRGCQEILAGVDITAYSQVLLACGTGTTMAGLVSATTLPVTGIQVLKGALYLERELARLLDVHGLTATAPWRIFDRFHRGGYGRVDAELLDFIGQFTASTGIPLEPVYSGKLMLAIADLVRAGEVAPGARLLVIHGGGLQGARGWQ